MNDASPDIAVTESAAAASQTPEPGPGNQLREARDRQGLTVADVARHLKLHPRQVEALERDAFTELPGPVFVRGFMRNYARLVGLEGEVLVSLAERVGGLPAAPRSTVTTGVPRSTEIPASLHEPLEKSRARKGWLPVTVVLILLAAGIVYYNSRSVAPPPPQISPAATAEPATAPAPTQPAEGPADAGNALVPPPAESVPAQSPAAAAPELVVPPSVSGPASPPAPPSSTQPTAPTAVAPEAGSLSAKPTEPPKTPAPVKPAADTRTASEQKPASKPETREGASLPAAAPLDVTPQRAAGGPEIRLSFSRESWVEVRDASGSVIFSQLNPAGTERVIRGQPPFQVTVGNAGGVSVRYNSREIDLGPSTRTDVAHITLE